MSFAHPIWLWGIAALLIPLIIHLWSRQKTRILPFGSLRFLQESSSSQSRSIQLTDVGLMLLRILLFLLLVLFIAQINWNSEIENEKWLVLGEDIATPNAYLDEGYKIHKINDLKTTSEYLTQWHFLQELSQNYPEIDSLVWIDHFENSDFWGAIPLLSFDFELINKGGNEIKQDSFSIPVDFIFYSFDGIEEQKQDVFYKIIKANEVYLNSDIVFKEKSNSTSLIVFSNEQKDKVPLQFVIEKSNIKTWRAVENWPYKTIYISDIYIADKRLYDELLLLISEQIAQYLIPEWSYNDWQQVTRIQREKLDKALISQTAESNNEGLFWIIIALFLLERFWVYQKRNG
jgi:hypothetical protein